MNDRDILRHERLDRVNIFGIENHSDLPAGCEAIVRFANIATFSGKLHAWLAASRVERSPQRNKADGTTPPAAQP